ncbi:aldehyde dehydrogenase family protein [Catenulispora sp. EB89]|uniref:aldehyde dehydrogenase family protein n=1 Tax=Catenulispora sp. EB89 TaxID=3156257 RepID=UPI0035171FAD
MAEVPSAVLAELPAPLSGDFEVRHMPRGRTFGVVAPSNHPGPHLAWLHALALGYSVVIRPGSRDPFTPFRLASALFEAGLPAGRLSVLPGSYASADFLISHADLALAYGGPDSMARWSAAPSVALRGPGRSKTLLAQTIDQQALDFTCRAIAHDGGVLCTNTSAVLTIDDPFEIASLIAMEFDKAPLYTATDTRCVLPTFKRGQAEALIRVVNAMTSSSLRRIGGVTDDIVELDDGSVVVRPIVLATDDPHHPAIGTELPFPFALVASWDRALGAAQLRNSLALTVIGAPDLAEEVVREPTIRRVVIGPADPWAVHPGLPHDGSLVGFLTEAKALIKSP